MAMSLELRLVASSFPSSKPGKQNKIETFSWFKYVLTHIRHANSLEQLEQLLPYNIEPALLSNMHSLPNLICPKRRRLINRLHLHQGIGSKAIIQFLKIMLIRTRMFC